MLPNNLLVASSASSPSHRWGIRPLHVRAVRVLPIPADGPRFRLWLASLFTPRPQGVFINVWDVTASKTGGYVAARVVLATPMGRAQRLSLIIGMPGWLALGIWTGSRRPVCAGPSGTYIAIVPPRSRWPSEPEPVDRCHCAGLGNSGTSRSRT